MPKIPLLNIVPAPQTPKEPFDPASGSATAKALAGFGQQITGFGAELKKIEDEKARQASLVAAAELTANFDTRLAEIESEEAKLPLEERDKFRVEELERTKKELLTLGGEKGQDTLDILGRTFPGRESAFLASAFSRDTKNQHDENRAIANESIRTMTEKAIEGSDEMLAQRLTEIGAFTDGLVKLGTFTAQEGDKILAETGRTVKNTRHRIAMLADPYEAQDRIEKDKTLLEADRLTLVRESLNEQQRQVNLFNQLQNQQDAIAKRAAEEKEKDLMGIMFQDPSTVLGELKKAGVNRVLGFSRTKRLRDMAVAEANRGADPLQSDEKTYWKYRRGIREAVSNHELDILLEDLVTDRDMTRADRKDVANRTATKRLALEKSETTAFEDDKKRATSFLKRMFKVTGEFMPDPTGQGVEVMIERMDARLKQDPTLSPMDVAQKLAISQAKLLGTKPDGFVNLIKSLEFESAGDVIKAWASPGNLMSREEKNVLLTIFAMAATLGIKHPGAIIEEAPSPKKKSTRSKGTIGKFKE